jgi:hypothetical protein
MIVETSSKLIFSVMFLVLMLSSWLEMNTMFFSTSFQPYFLIHALSVLSEKIKVSLKNNLTMCNDYHQYLQEVWPEEACRWFGM